MATTTAISSLQNHTSTILHGILHQLQNHTSLNPFLAANAAHSQRPIYDGDSVYPSNHPFVFPERQNTPLSVPESDLFTVTGDYSPGDGLLGGRGADYKALGWIIPTVIGVVAAMVILGLLCFFGVRALELKCMRCCQRNCACCCETGEEGHVLTTTAAINQTEMTNYKSAFSPDGDEW